MGLWKDVLINADYTGIKLGFENNYNFNFTINLSYASFSGKDEVTVKNSNVKSGSKKYSGYHGTENSGNNVNITSDYGGVTLIKQ